MTEGDGGNKVYRFSVSPGRMRVYRDGMATLENSIGGVSKTWIQRYRGRREIVGSVQNNNAVQLWTYPTGRLLRTIDSGLDQPDGVVVSLARKQRGQ